MDITKLLKMAMLEKNLKQVEVASRVYDSKNSRVTFNNLLRRNDYRLEDIIRVADVLDYDVRLQLVDRQTGKIIEA